MRLETNRSCWKYGITVFKLNYRVTTRNKNVHRFEHLKNESLFSVFKFSQIIRFSKNARFFTLHQNHMKQK